MCTERLDNGLNSEFLVQPKMRSGCLFPDGRSTRMQAAAGHKLTTLKVTGDAPITTLVFPPSLLHCACAVAEVAAATENWYPFSLCVFFFKYSIPRN